MITISVSQFNELRNLALEAINYRSKDASYDRCANLLGGAFLSKLDKLNMPKQICFLCKKDYDAKNKSS